MRLPAIGRKFCFGLFAALLVTGPASAFAQEASPSSTPTSVNATFFDMLGLSPDTYEGNSSPSEIAEFADVELQLAEVGVASPPSLDDPGFRQWFLATMWLPFPRSLQTRGLDPDWHDVFGFDLLQIDQSLVTGEPPEQITFLRGRFDQSEVTTALTNTGYQSVDVEGVPAYSLFADTTIDLANPASQLALNSMNNAVFLPDGTLVFAATLDLIREVVAVSQGNATSLADRLDVSALVQAMPRPLATAVLVPGSALLLGDMMVGQMIEDPNGLDELMAEIEQLGEMPPITMGLIGVTPGGPLQPVSSDGTPESSPVPLPDVGAPAALDIGLLTLTLADAREAEQIAVARIGALDSLRYERPYSELFTNVTPAGPADLPVAVIELGLSDEILPSIWADLLFSRDMLFVGW
jgi:hypothetical protein